MSEFVFVCKVDDVPAGSAKQFTVNGTEIALARVEGGECYAIGCRCTHLRAKLGRGSLEGRTLTCPWHAGDWNVETGEAEGLPVAGTLPTYKVRVTGDDLEVETPV